MEIFFEIVFNLIVEGSLEAARDKKVSLPLRIIAAVVLLAVYGGGIGFLIYIGIRDKSVIILVLAALILFVTVSGFLKAFRKRK